MHDLWSLLSFIVIGAVIDSIDPCIYALYLSILVPTLVNIRRCIAMAMAFIFSVFFGYLLFNGFLRLILSVSTPPRWILSIVLMIYAIIIGLYTIFFEDNRSNEVCREDRVLCKILNRFNLGKLSLSVTGVIILGFIASFTVLPCTAGMAIAFNIITLRLGLATWVPLAILYTLIFILPLIALSLIVIGLTKIEKIYEAILRRQKLIKIGGAVLMICIAIWIIITEHLII